MSKKPILLRDLITRLAQCDPNELYVEMEETEPDVFILPFSVLPHIAQVGGTVQPLSDPVSQWPAGTIVTLARKCTNNAVNSGNQSITIEPATDSPMFIDRIAVFHDDNGGSRTLFAAVYTSAGFNTRYLLFSASTADTSKQIWPEGRETLRSSALVSSDWEVMLRGAAIAVTKTTYFFMQYRYIGSPPVVTEAGPTDAVWAPV